MKCSECRFWDQRQPEKPLGECRRHAPVATTGTIVAYWQTTKADEWCGEFAKREPAP